MTLDEEFTEIIKRRKAECLKRLSEIKPNFGGRSMSLIFNVF